jgi:uroporphyrin-III C-methyltransferase/precorrin-2 dehydrogenase/sirohydrochlorin ferrochelatase
MQHGMPADMPIALIQKGTTRDQKIVIATLLTMVETLKSNPVSAPTLIIVGRVVNLHSKLNWFNPAS